MGASSSSSNLPPSPSAPPRARNKDAQSAFHFTADEPHRSEYTQNDASERVLASSLDVVGEPQSQGPSPYATLRVDEWWDQRPSAPSLPNLRTPRQEASLQTYATQMTGWQTAGGHDPSTQHRRQSPEIIELSRIISQLATANQQLVAAYNVTLAHLEALYVELKREREARRLERTSTEFDSNIDRVPRERMRDEEEEEEEKPSEREERKDRRRIELRVGRIENLLSERSCGCCTGQRSTHREEDSKLRARVERLENLLNVRNNVGVEDRVDHRFDLLENDSHGNGIARGVCFAGDVSGSAAGGSACDGNLHLEEHVDEKRTKSDGTDRSERASEEIGRLSDEIERLKADRVEYRCVNERLLAELSEQKLLIDKLTKDYETSKARYTQLEDNLEERRQQYDELTRNFQLAKEETERLLKEVDAFHLEKDTAEAKISSLEEDLQKSLFEKEQIRSIESQKTSKLKAQLSEEVSDKKRQVKALEDALDEIQRLKETVKTERELSNDATVSTKDVGTEDTMDEPQEGSSDRSGNMEDFKKELTLKREARQRAIAAVSSEMERLRRELDAEKEAHSETSRVLELLRSAQSHGSQGETDVDDVCASGKNSNSAESSKTKSKLPEEEEEQEILLKQKEAQRLTSILKVSDELRNDVRCQIEKVDDLRYQLESESERHRHRIRSLMDITNNTREAVTLRERRANELKDHLAQILVRVGDRSFLDPKDDLVGTECERQLENIESLKTLFNERLKVLTELKDGAVKELVDVKEKLDHSLKKSETLEEDLRRAEEKIDAQGTEISNLESQLGLTKADCRDLQNQISLINGLFTQMLLGASSADMDLDRLTQLLQENHDLICEMAREEGTEAAALPKLLLDLVEQVEGSKATRKRAQGDENSDQVVAEAERKEEDLQQEDIAHNLPKVWRVLLELLSCHAVGASTSSVASSSDPNSCYKSVDTPAGPRLVISVSKTYIRLKELILEKKHLEKEMNRMKQLNAHLESKLGEQEKRLSAVSAELSKTWNIVGRMQAQHQQLHTHEKILRYELQQKRKMLQELKQELEYCREKWESARQKNTNTELEWRSLRREFAARKALVAHDSFSNSAESGFSDERGDDTDEEDDRPLEDRIRLGPRRRTRKESPRVPSPDTESEQPTDTELSDPKCSPANLEKRTPTPDTETELDEVEIMDVDLNVDPAAILEEEPNLGEIQEALDPLDRALSNVIQKLITIDDTPQDSGIYVQEEINVDPVMCLDQSSPTVKESSSASYSLRSDLSSSHIPTVFEEEDPNKGCSISIGKPSESETIELLETETVKVPSDSTEASGKDLETTDATPNTTMSVFSIGPIPPAATTFSKSVQFSEPLVVGPSNRSFTSTCEEPLTSMTEGAASNDELNLEEKRNCKSMDTVADSDSVSVDSSSSLETVKEFPAKDSPTRQSEVASTSDDRRESAPISGLSRASQDTLDARADRLRRLEEQAEWLMKKMNATSKRGSALSMRLEELHEAYGEPPVPPPMPDVLPARRLRTVLSDDQRSTSSTVDESTEGAENTETRKCTVNASQNNTTS